MLTGLIHHFDPDWSNFWMYCEMCHLSWSRFILIARFPAVTHSRVLLWICESLFLARPQITRRWGWCKHSGAKPWDFTYKTPQPSRVSWRWRIDRRAAGNRRQHPPAVMAGLKRHHDGKIAGLYDLDKTLGRGHFAVVKLARHVFTGEKVHCFVVSALFSIFHASCVVSKAHPDLQNLHTV